MALKLISFEEELKRNPELKEDDIQALKEWHEKQPHLPSMTDSEFALFLHSNFYRIEPTKNTIDDFYTVRTHMTELFSNRDIEKDKYLNQITKCVLTICDSVIFPLPTLTKDGYGIIYGVLSDFEPSHYDFVQAIKMLSMILDLWLYQLGTIAGHMIIFDLKGLALGHVGRFNLSVCKKFTYYLTAALPVRFKGIHFINSNPAMDMIMNMTRPFLKKEQIDMFHFHQKPVGLEKFNISVEILPNEAGGKAGSQRDLFEQEVKKLKDYRDWFLHDEKNQRVNETKRPGKAKIASDLFGIEGSFKKLELD